jgi:hypothetical protein
MKHGSAGKSWEGTVGPVLLVNAMPVFIAAQRHRLDRGRDAEGAEEH